jgi:hypothetical protein
MILEFLTYPMIGKSIRCHLLLRKKISSIEDIGWLLHQLIKVRIGICFEDVPLGKDNYGMRVTHCLHC